MKKESSQRFLFVAIVVASMSLRAPITAVGPLIGSIRASLQMPGAALGMLTTIPLIMFALVSPFVSRLSGRAGAGRTMLYSLLVMSAGLVLRSYAGVAGLFIGTTLIGFGAAFGNVLIPGVIKSRFRARVGVVTSAFTIAMSCFASIASAVSYPLSGLPGLGWRGALAVWLALTLAAAAFWWFERKSDLRMEMPDALPDAPEETSVYRSPTAWWLTVLMGVQALMFYFFTAWLPTILQSRGISPTHAGYMTFAYQLMTMPSSFIIPVLAERGPDQKRVTTAIAILYALSVTAFLLVRNPVLTTISVMACGFSTGACFSLCMLLISLRTRSAARAIQLSGMVQALGYAVAAVGPTLAGLVYDATGSWTAPLVCALGLTGLIVVAGRKAGANRYI